MGRQRQRRQRRRLTQLGGLLVGGVGARSDGNATLLPAPPGSPMTLPARPAAGGMQDGAMAGRPTSYCLANCLNSAASLLGSTRLSVLEAIVLPSLPARRGRRSPWSCCW